MAQDHGKATDGIFAVGVIHPGTRSPRVDRYRTQPYDSYEILFQTWLWVSTGSGRTVRRGASRPKAPQWGFIVCCPSRWARVRPARPARTRAMGIDLGQVVPIPPACFGLEGGAW